MKRLHDDANMLEEQRNIESEDEPIVHVKKAWVYRNDDGTSSPIYHESCNEANKSLPEIKAKAEGKDVIIRVHCENKNGYLGKVVEEIEKLKLSVQNITSLPFGDYFLDITVTAQMDDEFCMTMKDLKRDLREALLCFM